jgi:hypothetical protein
MSENETMPLVIKDQPVLDLSHLTEPEQLAAISKIENVALVLVPESLAAAYVAIPLVHVAQTVYVPSGSNARVHTGTLEVGGDGIGAEDDVLVVVGLLLITSPVTGPLPRHIHVTGSVLAPRGSEQVLGKALAGGTGAVTYYPYVEGQQLRMFGGQVKLTSALLANSSGGADDVLLCAGQVLVTGEVATVGFKTALVAGQFIAPEASRDVLEPAVQIHGQAAWYQGTKPKVFNDDTELGRDFFRLLREPVSVVVLGDLTIAAGVTEEMLFGKLSGLTVLGDLIAPQPLLGAVQVIAEVFGATRTPEAANGGES